MKITKIAAVLLSLALVIGMFGYSTFSASAKYVPVQPPEDNTENPTGYCEETYAILPRSNYCYTVYEGIPNVNSIGSVKYRAPEDLEIVSFQFTLYRENTDLELVNYSSFTGQMAFNTNFDDSQVILKGSMSSLDPILVEKDEPILNLEFLSETIGKYDLYLEIEDLQVRTESGDKIIIQNGVVLPDPDEEETTVGSTNHCTEQDTTVGYTDHCTEQDTTADYTYPDETEAPTENIAFTEATTEAAQGFPVGDVDNSGYVDINDATLIQRHIAEFTDKNGNPIIDENCDYLFYIANTYRDGVINIQDATEIQKYLAEFVSTLG